MTARATFRQADVARAVRGVVAAGVKVARIEIDRAGKIIVYAESAANDDAPNPWDDGP